MIRIRWTGDNFLEVISHIGLYEEGFKKWFHSSYEEYEKYVHEHGDTIKIFNSLGEHILTAHIGDTIVKTYSGLIYVLSKQRGGDK